VASDKPKSDLADALGVGRVPDDEIRAVVSTLFPLSRWEDETRVSYFDPEQGHVLDLVYDRDGVIADCEASQEMPALAGELREKVAAELADDGSTVIYREVLFSGVEVKGYWRHSDGWQILPVPATAPRPAFPIAEHPFVLEHRVRSSSNNLINIGRRRRQLWELQLLLSLLLRRGVTRESEARPHHWMILEEPTRAGLQTAYLNEGYLIGAGFEFQALQFSDCTGIAKLRSVPDAEYYARRRRRAPDEMDVPESLGHFVDRVEAADPQKREKLMAAAYWYDAAYRVWDTSKALSFIAAINAVEAVFPSGRQGHQCPACKRFHDSPGPTARFSEFVEKYAAAEDAEDRKKAYALRSAFVHRGELHGLDVPGAWGSLTPDQERHRSLHDDALAISRSVIRNWFLSDMQEACGDEAHPDDGGE
jgi:hypothetical protein